MRRLRQVQLSDRLPAVVASEDKVRPVVLVDRSQLAQGVGASSLSSWSFCTSGTSSGTGGSSSDIHCLSQRHIIWFMGKSPSNPLWFTLGILLESKLPPSGRVLCRMRTDLGTAEGIESREPVHFVTQQTRRFALINNILQHPEQLPSMYELEELNPSVSEATVYKHIQSSIDAGIVKEVALTMTSAGRDIPEVLRPHRGGPDLPRRTQSPRRGGNPPTDLRDHL